MPTCQNCQQQFTIYNQDEAFYSRIGVPDPKNCPECREQNRAAWRNERNLYLRKCEGCKKQIVSIYSPDKKYHIYCPTCWWSDKWDPIDQGRDFDFNRSFFDQFDELIKDSKLISLFGRKNINSNYVNQETDDKNCYLCFGGHYNEDCYYNTYSIWGKNNIDNYWVLNSELCYQCIDCEKLFNCTNCRESSSLTDCHYCYDCVGCTNCFGSVGLRHKSFYFFNQQLEKEEYEKKVKESLSSFANREKARIKTNEHIIKYPRRYAIILKSENSTGDHLINCRNVQEGFTVEEADNCCYVYIGLHIKDSWDLTSFGWGELLYNVGSSIELNDVIGASSAVNVENSRYIFVCYNSDHLFGCTGLNKKKYCILNKQYSQADYKKITIRIIEHMKKTGEWGEFMPILMSPFCYNETVAHEYFPLTKKECDQKKYGWHEEDINKNNKEIKGMKKCISCDHGFKIIPQEKEYYEKLNLPDPLKCPKCRHIERLTKRNPRKLWDRNCAKCGTNINTVFSPSSLEIPYCEDCYKKEIY